MKIKAFFWTVLAAIMFVAMAVLLPGCANGSQAASDQPTTNLLVQHPEYSISEWTLVIYAWQGEVGVAATSIPGFGTSKACGEAAKFAMLHRHTQDAFCVAMANHD